MQAFSWSSSVTNKNQSLLIASFSSLRMMWHSFFLFGVMMLWLRWRYLNRKLLAAAKLLPGPPPLPVLGNALLFMCHPEELKLVLRKLLNEYGRVFRFWLGPELNIVVSEPEDIKLLLSDQKTNHKGPKYRYMADVLGEGILSGSGPIWRKHRKIASPNYGKKAIESYEEIFNKEVDELLKNLRVVDGQELDVYNYIVRTTSYAVCQTLMGLTKEESMSLPHIQNIIRKTPRLYDILFDRMIKWYLQIDSLYWMTNYFKELKNFMKQISEFSEKILHHRLVIVTKMETNQQRVLMTSENDEMQNTKLSVIDRFILSRELNTDELLKETFTVFTSSQEASAKISSFILLMMAYHPNCQDKLYQEIIYVMGDKDRPVTDQDLKQMLYLDMIFKEVLRLFPIATMLQRTINYDIPISVGIVPAGCSLMVPIYHLHRDPHFWNNPDDFDPERFNLENSLHRKPNCYIPFSMGNMDCMGRHFGTKLIKTVCVRTLREFSLTSSNNFKDLRISIAISASSLNGFKLCLTSRK